MSADFSSAAWRKSSRSNGYGGNCVEVVITHTTVGVRDTKDRGGGILVLTTGQWAHFLNALKSS